MRPPPRVLPACLALAAAISAAATAWGQTSPDPPKPTVIVVRPAAAPVPVFSIRLLPPRLDLVPGNAALFYHRAFEMVHGHRSAQQSVAPPPAPGQPAPESPEALLGRWATCPLSEIPVDEARKALDAHANVLHETELGARRLTCDWGFDLRSEGFELMMPEVQGVRTLARLTALRARLAVIDGKTDEAVYWIQTSYAMGRHVSEGPSLIQALVGAAITNVTSRCVEDLIQAPGTPSLYWALTDLPRPFIDIGAALEGERNVIDRMLPKLRDAESVTWSTDEARRVIDDMMRKLAPLVGGGNPPAPGARPSINEMGTRLAVAAMVTKVYPEARRALIARGRSEAEVDAMPASQVALIHTLRAYHAMRDDMYKWTKIPYWQAGPRLQQNLPPMRQEGNPLLTVIAMIEPAVNAARLAEVRTDRQLDVLRTVEAIRLHAAAHDNALPKSLDDIKDVPVPLDPGTGKPFEYALAADGKSATLSGPIPPGAVNHPSYAVRLELKLEPARPR